MTVYPILFTILQIPSTTSHSAWLSGSLPRTTMLSTWGKTRYYDGSGMLRRNWIPQCRHGLRLRCGCMHLHLSRVVQGWTAFSIMSFIVGLLSIQGSLSGSMLQLETTPLGPGGQQPYNGAHLGRRLLALLLFICLAPHFLQGHMHLDLIITFFTS